MSPVGPINSLLTAAPLIHTEGAAPVRPGPSGASASTGFAPMMENLIGMVDQKMAASNALSTSVMLGDSSQLHQSVIAMQQASVALDLMVQVRNKLVESYQELMRMQV